MRRVKTFYRIIRGNDLVHFHHKALYGSLSTSTTANRESQNPNLPHHTKDLQYISCGRKIETETIPNNHHHRVIVLLGNTTTTTTTTKVIVIATTCATRRSEEMVLPRTNAETATTFLIHGILAGGNSITNREQAHPGSSIDGRYGVNLPTGPITEGNTERMIEGSIVEIFQQEGKTKKESSTAEDLKAEGVGATEVLRTGGIGMREDQETGERTTS